MTTKIEIIVLGTGPSGGLPQLGCLTRPQAENDPDACRCCLATREDTEDDFLAGGRKNVRGNTSCVVRKTWADGRESCILFDCGKTFARGAVEHFPKHGLRKIDAVVLSHDHADAIFGLDDLRMFTRPRFRNGKDAIQETVHIYCDAKTFGVLEKRFPYWVSTNANRGSTSAGDMTFHIIEPNRAYTIAGIYLIPLEVEHGFNVVPATSSNIRTANDSPRPIDLSSDPVTVVVPYMTLAFLIEDQVLWMTDASRIPPRALDILRYGLARTDSQEDSTHDRTKRQLAIAFVDLSEVYPLRSHLSLQTFLQMVDRLEARETYAIGINHTLCHGEIEALGEEVQGVRRAGREDDFLCRVLYSGEKIALDAAWDRLKEKKLYFRPSFDGMSVEVEVAEEGGKETL